MAYCKADPQAYLQKPAYAYCRQPDSSAVGAYQEKLAVDDQVAWADEVAAPEQHLVVVAKAPSHRKGPSSCRYRCGQRSRQEVDGLLLTVSLQDRDNKQLERIGCRQT